MFQLHIGDSCIEGKHTLLKRSNAIDLCLSTYLSFVTPKSCTFYKYYCNCIKGPSIYSCVNIKKSTLSYYLKEMCEHIIVNKNSNNCLLPAHTLFIRGQKRNNSLHALMLRQKILFIYQHTVEKNILCSPFPGMCLNS